MYVFRFNRDRDLSRNRRGGSSRGNSRGSSDNIRGSNMNRFGGPARITSNNSRGGMKGKQPGGALRKVNWDIRSLEPLRKDFYIEHPSVKTR